MTVEQRRRVDDALDNDPLKALVMGNLCDALARGGGEEALVRVFLASLPTSSGFMSRKLEKFLGMDSVFGAMKLGETSLDTMMSDALFVSGYRKFEARDYAFSLGYRVASRTENEFYLKDLVEKHKRDTLDEVERKAFDFYVRGEVCDTDGRLSVLSGTIRAYSNDRPRQSGWQAYASRPWGPLMVRAAGDSLTFLTP